MSSQKHIHDELRSFGSELPSANNPFVVPEGYFDDLAASILSKINRSNSQVQAELDELSPFLASLPKKMPYTVPPSYFEENSNVVNFTQAETSLVLENIGKKIPYSVPHNYFESFSSSMLERVAKPKAKVVPLFARTWMRIASAAAVAGALIFGGYQLLNNRTDQAITAANKTPETTNQKLVASNLVPFSKQIKQVPTKELEEFIETVQVSAKVPEKEIAAASKSEVEDLLKDVSTNEMESFLSALPTADDEMLIID